MLLIVVLLFGSVIGFNLFKQKMVAQYLANMPEPEYPVTVTTVNTANWVPTIESIGFIEPNQGVTLTTESSGVVQHIAFDSGSSVAQGQLLVSLNSDVEKANLRSSKVRLPAAEAKYQRYKGLYQKGSVSKEAFDDAEASYFSLQADIESLKAAIARREIEAPFDGVVGIRNVFLGQYLQPGTDIVRLEDTSVMRLRFTIPQTEISEIFLGQQVNIVVDSFPDKIFNGNISAIEPAVDYQSGLIQVQADIPNNGGKLRSGMFARASIVLSPLTEQMVITQTAISYTLYGDSVFVLYEENGVKRVRQQVINIGERKADKVHILSGIEAGDIIVTSGQVRLSNSAKVRVVESDATISPATTPLL